ncbi:MAG: hypothetical protein J5756_07695 [Clostridia bacterium]|nr:hypothetical protein [Clostridia bacterium]MBR5769016.1 hypothetical protein [Clostridia bacterium]
MKKALSRLGVGTARIALSALVVAVLLTVRFCGGNTSGVKREIVSGGSTIGVVKYVVGKYNEFTA